MGWRGLPLDAGISVGFFPNRLPSRVKSALKDTLRAALGWTPHLRAHARLRRDPVGTQQALLRRLLRTAADTEWGRRYDFAEIAAAPDVTRAFRERVPLHTYDDLRADARRIRNGAEDVIWPGRMTHFAVSSGTTSDGKIIPLSKRSLAADRRFSIGAGLHYLAETGDPSFLFGKHLTLPGRIAEDDDFPGTLVGEVSGLVAEQAPSYFRNLLQAVPNEVAFLPDWNRKLTEIARRTATMDVRLVVMAPTWALVLFEKLMAEYERQTGRRADTVADVWPNLQVFISGGVTLSSYRELLDKRIGRPRGQPVDFLETYGASEGFFSFQSDQSDSSMLLHLGSEVFYEFVPLDQLDADGDEPERLTIAEVETGVRYALVVSNASGLWAYRVGDVVRFTGLFPHKIEVAGRTSEMVDAYGEAVFGEEARAAMQAACRAVGTRMRDFHLAPHPEADDENGLPSHQWLVEFESGARNGNGALDRDRFARALDEHLQQVNRHYRIRREAEAFGAPTVEVLPSGTFYRWLQHEKERVTGQTKVPRMSEERDVADEVLRVA